MITKLRLQNFKCWQDTGELRIAPITALFGANSSGKSSILQLLLMLKQTCESSDRAQVLDFGEGERAYVELGTLHDILYKHGSERGASELSWNLEWKPRIQGALREGNTVTHYDLIAFWAAIRSADTDSSRPKLNGFYYEMRTTGSGIPWRLGILSNDASSDLVSPRYVLIQDPVRMYGLPPVRAADDNPIKCYGFSAQLKREYPIPARTDYDTPFSELEALFEDLFAHVHYLGPLREPAARFYQWSGLTGPAVGRRGERTIAALLDSQHTSNNGNGHEYTTGASETPQEAVARWLKRLGLIDEFNLERITGVEGLFRAMVRRSEDSTFVPITDVGFGVSQVLPVITLCYTVPESSIILFEQPEIHLHPAVQTGLADLFVEVAERRNLQLIIESHSEHLLARLQRRVADETIPAESVALYCCELTPEQKITPLELDEYGNIRNWPSEFFGDELGERASMMEAIMRRKSAAAS